MEWRPKRLPPLLNPHYIIGSGNPPLGHFNLLTAMSPTLALASSPLFQPIDPNLSLDERTQISYNRAVAIAKEYGEHFLKSTYAMKLTPSTVLTPEDVVFMTPKFWAFHVDQIAPLDGAAITLLVIQYNLAAGTLGPFAMKRPELRPLLKRIMDFEVS